MFKNNSFFITNFKNVVFIGEHKCLSHFININNSLNIKTLVITSPDQSKLIDKKIKFKVFNKLDKKFKRYVLQEVKVEETLFISIKSRWIFNDQIIKNFFKNNLINYHPGRLPYYRGGATFSWRIMNGDRIDCQIFHLVNKKIDDGPIIFSENSIVPKKCVTPLDFENYNNIQIIKLYEKFITRLKKKNKFLMIKQAPFFGQYYPRLNSKIHGWIDWSISSSKLSKFIDSFDEPYSGASTLLKKEVVYLKQAHLHGGEISKHNYLSGLVSRHDKNWIVVCTSDENSLLVEKVLDKKGNNIIKKVKAGDRFYTPESKLSFSKKYKAQYGPKGLIK